MPLAMIGFCYSLCSPKFRGTRSLEGCVPHGLLSKIFLLVIFVFLLGFVTVKGRDMVNPHTQASNNDDYNRNKRHPIADCFCDHNTRIHV